MSIERQRRIRELLAVTRKEAEHICHASGSRSVVEADSAFDEIGDDDVICDPLIDRLPCRRSVKELSRLLDILGTVPTGVDERRSK